MKLINILFLILLIPISSAITIDNDNKTFTFSNVNVNFSSNQTYDLIELGNDYIKLSDTVIQIIPSSGTLNVTIKQWGTMPNYYKAWNESSTNPAITTLHTIGDLPPDTAIQLKRNGVNYDTYTSNSSGYIVFTYSGGYSDIFFELDAYHPPTGSGDSGGGGGNNSNPTPTPVPTKKNGKPIIIKSSDGSLPTLRFSSPGDDIKATITYPDETVQEYSVNKGGIILVSVIIISFLITYLIILRRR